MPRSNEPPALINPIEMSDEDRAIVDACTLVRSIAKDRDKQAEDDRRYLEFKTIEVLESVDALRRELDGFQDSSQHQPGHEERRLRIRRRLSILNEYAVERPVTASPPVLPVSMPVDDVKRLTSAKERVQRLMSDGQWHTAVEIREVGGSEGLRRLREIRDDGKNRGVVVEKRRIRPGGGSFAYRVRTPDVWFPMKDGV